MGLHYKSPMIYGDVLSEIMQNISESKDRTITSEARSYSPSLTNVFSASLTVVLEALVGSRGCRGIEREFTLSSFSDRVKPTTGPGRQNGLCGTKV
jgi:hypothetical protein